MSDRPENDFIGQGKESTVYPHPDHPDRVVKISREHVDPEESKDVIARFYLTRILHLIFPQMIPNVHLEALKDGRTRIEVDRAYFDELTQQFFDAKNRFRKGEGLSREERITKQERLAYKEQYDNHERRVQEDPRVNHFLEVLKEIDLDIDYSPVNFGFEESGNPVYVDRLWTGDPEESKLINREKMDEIIETRLEPDEETPKKRLKAEKNKQKARKWLDRYFKVLTEG